MLLLTIVPENIKVLKVFSMIQMTGTVRVSKENIISRIINKNKDEYKEIIEAFKKQAPKDANAIIGVNVTTSTQMFSNGTFTYLTYTGNPAIVEEVQ